MISSLDCRKLKKEDVYDEKQIYCSFCRSRQLRLLPAAATVKAVGGASNDASAAGGDTAAAGDAADEGGKVFGVTTYRSLVTSVYIVMRTDVLEDLGPP